VKFIQRQGFRRYRQGPSWVRLRWATATLALALIAAGGPSCAIFRAPSTPEQPVEAPARVSQDGEAALAQRWWESLDDPELNRLIEQALSGNFDLQTAWDRLDQSAALARKAGAALRPQLNGEVAVSRTRSERDASSGTAATTGEASTATTTDSISLALSASYEVDLWGRVRSVRRAAELNLLASGENLSAAAITVSAEVANKWYGIVQQRAVLKLLAEQVKTNSEFLELVELRFKHGKASAVDVLQQRRQLESTKGQMPIARMQLALFEHQLAVLLGKGPQYKTAGALDALPGLPPLPRTGLPAELVRRRPDLRAAHARLAGANENIAAAAADRFPALRLTARGQTDADDLGGLFDNWLTNLAANLAGPILDGGSRSAEVARTRAVASERLHEYAGLILNALKEVEDALVREQQQRDYLVSLDTQLELARQVVAESRLRYVNGATDYLPVLESLSTLQQLERSGYEARRLLIEYRIGLYRALGGGWDMQRNNSVTTTTNVKPGESQ